MRSLDHRMHLLLDGPRYRKVSAAAERQGVSVAEVIRRAIDQLPDGDGRRRSAVQAILASTPVPVPVDPADLRRESDRARDRPR